MAEIVDLERWRRTREDGAPPGEAAEARLRAAVDRLEAVLARLGWERQAPPWVVTDLLAIQGAVSLGLTDDAARRAESLVARSERRWARTGR